MEQVIKLDLNGDITSLRTKKGQGLDLLDMKATAKVERVSEVLWSDDDQGFYVKILRGKHANKILGGTVVHQVMHYGYDEVSAVFGDEVRRNGDGVYIFRDYDQAVRLEVMFLNASKLSGL
jgi:hypothetical protein